MKNVDRALEELIGVFERMKTAYAVMGGIAVRFYGIPRPTQDVDFTVALDRGQLKEMFRAVIALGYSVPEQYEAGWVDEVAGMPLIKVRRYLEDQGVDVDVFLAESEFQRELLSRRRVESLDGLAVSFVSPEDLILLKLLANRPRDIADISDVLFIQGQLDEAYLRHWAKELGVLAALQNALAEPPPT